jgi:hypothetical protein
MPMRPTRPCPRPCAGRKGVAPVCAEPRGLRRRGEGGQLRGERPVGFAVTIEARGGDGLRGDLYHLQTNCRRSLAQGGGSNAPWPDAPSVRRDISWVAVNLIFCSGGA